jgi:prepilin-type N-terminal cleavage/methylation domain-containing protein
MILRLAQKNREGGSVGFTLVEVLISLVVFGMLTSGLIYGYCQANRMAEWSSMSLAAQSYASEGLESAKSAQWNSEQYPPTNGPGTDDEMRLFDNAGVNIDSGGNAAQGHTNYMMGPDTMDVPTTGTPIYVTNYITITNVSLNPQVRQIRSDCVWAFPLTGQLCTNTVVSLRAPDQ